MKVDAKSKMMFERFLIKNDFHIPEYDGRIISFEIDSIKDSYLENLKVNIDDIDKRVYSIDNLPIELKADYKNNIRPNIESEYMIENISGDKISDLSLVLENKGRILTKEKYGQRVNRPQKVGFLGLTFWGGGSFKISCCPYLFINFQVL